MFFFYNFRVVKMSTFLIKQSLFVKQEIKYSVIDLFSF